MRNNVATLALCALIATGLASTWGVPAFAATAGADDRAEIATEISGVKDVSNVSKSVSLTDTVKVSNPHGRHLYLEQKVDGKWVQRRAYALRDDVAKQRVKVSYTSQWKKRTYTTWRLRVPGKTVAGTGGSEGARYEPAKAKTRVIAINAREQSVHSKAAAVLDEGGYVIFSKHRDQRRAMASTTKIMTALLAIERLAPEDAVTYSSAAAKTAYRTYYAFPTGTRFTRAAALRGMLLPSSNDMATAIACTVSGSNKKFAKLMTARARELGLKNTAFKNPHGLTARGHYSTAFDMASLMRCACGKAAFRNAARPGASYVVKSVNGKRSQRVRSTWIPMQKSTRVLKAGKTGYTAAAGKCFVGAYETKGHAYYIATLGSYGPDLLSNCWSDQKALFRYARQTR